MTTTQTIDGVLISRQLAERLTEGWNGTDARIELRALLDAPVEPVEVVQADNADQALTLLDFALSFALCNMDHGGTRRDVKKAQAHLESYRKFKAAQPQGEPVAWLNVATGHTTTSAVVVMDWDDEKEQVQSLYAEQPAPVAVVMPDRDSLRGAIAQAIGGDAYDCVRVWSAWGVGTMSEDDFVPVVDQEARLYEIADACLDELKRLNGEKP